MPKFSPLLLLGFLCCLLLSCSLPRLFWPQGDIENAEIVPAGAKHRVLVASRSSGFKDALVERIREDLEAEKVSMRFVGVQKLKYEDPRDFDAVVIINTCIAWGMDPQVDGFLNKNRDAGNIVVLTTSGDGKWAPDKRGRLFDAVASASEMARVDEAAEEILRKVRELLTVSRG
jgi:hypothetical protein